MILVLNPPYSPFNATLKRNIVDSVLVEIR